MKKNIGSVVVGACFALATYGASNVFDSAVFWFRGGKDLDGNGYIQQGEFFDDLHAYDATFPNHQMPMSSSWYYVNDKYATLRRQFLDNAVFRKEHVVFPALGTTIVEEMQVLHISDVAVSYNSKLWYIPFSVNPRSIFKSNSISNEYTIVSRIRLDELDRVNYLFSIGYNKSSNQGMRIGFIKPSSSWYAGCKRIGGYCTPNRDGNDAGFQLNLPVPTNTWIDVAVMVGNGNLRVGIAVPESLARHSNNPSIAFAQTPMWTENCPLIENDASYSFFCPANSPDVSQADQDCFLGSVQQLAIWGRRLEDEEVMEAFGMPRPALFRTGFDNGDSDNGGSNEFGGTRTNSTQTIEGLGSWQGVWNTMLANDIWTVNFTALRDEANLPQIFSIKSLHSSAAKIEVTLTNASCNVSLGERRVAANGRTFWPVAANLIAEGANTLVIKRTDEGADPFKMDAMELGGSLGVGTEDANITDGRTAPDRNPTGVPSAADPNLQHWSQGLQPYTGVSNVHFRVWVDSDVVNVNACSSRFWTQVRCYDRDGYSIQGDESASLCVNGVEKITHGPVKSWQPLELNFAPGELRAGWNDIEFKSAPYDTCHWYIRYYRFETVLSRGFSIPPYGTWISIK